MSRSLRDIVPRVLKDANEDCSFVSTRSSVSRTSRAMAEGSPYDRAPALVKLPGDAIEVSREQVIAAAEIIGPDSAAAAALKRADEYEGEGSVKFWYCHSDGLLTLQLLDDKRH